MLTYTILGVPCYSYSAEEPETLFELLRPLSYNFQSESYESFRVLFRLLGA